MNIIKYPSAEAVYKAVSDDTPLLILISQYYFYRNFICNYRGKPF